ncbi:unnamed protein product [Gongylonema pulchrum]|uniref:Integrase_H2C2 domain-containing protein n=1 Tax=Gongylonema pulchrum TaxID=637853 RepID=A0A183EC04_9BILA|nr:unnamed protein product [Gongylonema pulchrum]
MGLGRQAAFAAFIEIDAINVVQRRIRHCSSCEQRRMSALEHSCDPDAALIFSGTTATLRSLKEGINSYSNEDAPSIPVEQTYIGQRQVIVACGGKFRAPTSKHRYLVGVYSTVVFGSSQ